MGQLGVEIAVPLPFSRWWLQILILSSKTFIIWEGMTNNSRVLLVGPLHTIIHNNFSSLIRKQYFQSYLQMV